ncbi:MAG: glycosyltransferase family 39 protein [Anaerolineales bacterium]|nr:glycosyltransferase family 39 protein [Anaerolineales bacterium]
MNTVDAVSTKPTPWWNSTRLIWAMVALYLSLAGVFASVTPIFEGFDAQAHYAAINYYRATPAIPALTAETSRTSYELVTQPPLYYVLSALAATGWPVASADAVAKASINPYYDKSLSLRQSIILPQVDIVNLVPAWIARLVSLLGGLITLLCTWWLARSLVPERPSFAFAAAVIAALNPQFLFTSVTISNDAWAAATASLALAVAVDVYMKQRRPAAWFWVGAAVGLTGFAKYSALLIAVPVALVWLLAWRRMGWRRALAAAGYGLLGGGLVLGWWLIRNWMHYGELVPLGTMSQAIPALSRATPFTWARTFEFAPWLVASFWGVFVAIIAPPLYLDLTRWFMVLGIVGLGFGLVRRRRQTQGQWVIYLVLAPWLGLVALSILHWTRTVSYGEQGRLGHVGAAAFGVAMAAGWEAFAPARMKSWVHWGLVVAMTGAALWMATVLQGVHGLPAAVAQPFTPDRPLDVRFNGGMRLLGVDFPDGAAVAAGAAMPITLYFTTDQPITEDYTLFIHLASADDALDYQFDGIPVAGRHPTRQWLPGQVFADRHLIAPAAVLTDTLDTLSMGFYPIAERNQRVPVYSPTGELLGDRIELGAVRLQTQAPQASDTGAAPLLQWENGIALLEARPVLGASGAPASILLRWTADRPIQRDYTVSVQVLDGEDTMLAQVDRQPLAGAHPTSTWRAGDVINDTVLWGATPGLEHWARILVTLYGADGQRLATASSGNQTALPQGLNVLKDGLEIRREE